MGNPNNANEYSISNNECEVVKMKTRAEFEARFGKLTDAEWEEKEKRFQEIEQYIAQNLKESEESK